MEAGPSVALNDCGSQGGITCPNRSSRLAQATRYALQRNLENQQKKGNPDNCRCGLQWLPTCTLNECGRIPNDDLHGSLSEGEGACSWTCDDRSHLPLRGKLGWMTPRPGQKKARQRNASFGALVPKRGPHFYLRSSFPHASDCHSCKESPRPMRRVSNKNPLAYVLETIATGSTRRNTGIRACLRTFATSVSRNREASYSNDN